MPGFRYTVNFSERASVGEVMKLALLCLSAVLLDRWLGEPSRWHPLVGFGRFAHGVERKFYGPPTPGSRWRHRLRGLAALLCLVIPPALGAWLLSRLPYLGVVVETGLLYLALGAESLAEHAAAVAVALRRQDLALARQQVGYIVSRDTARLDAGQVSAAAVESVLENGCDAVFGALFWLLVAGTPGVMTYRLVNTLDAMWGYRTAHYQDFGWATARLDDGLNWVPARLTALSYTLLGRSRGAWQCWRSQAPTWKSPNAGAVMAAGAGALGLVLGGPAWYHGQWVQRPPLGAGQPPAEADIERAVRLVQQTLWLWVGMVWLWAGVMVFWGGILFA
jgi:adenosylcobinamide-phosphate synthase